MTGDSLDPVRDKVIGYYRRNAEKRFEQYESQAAGGHCYYSLKYMAPAPGRILDVGCGSGRDAAVFAGRGYDVTAVEPAHELRRLAQQKHDHANITWVDDRLPELASFHDVSDYFNHAHLSAVIFHLPPQETSHVLQNCHRLLKPGGTLFVGLRVGPSDPERPMFAIDEHWIASQADGLFDILDIELSTDDFSRPDVRWVRMMLKKV